MEPSCANLSLYRGDTAHFTVRIWEDEARTDPADLTGATAAAQVRPAIDAPEAMNMTCVITANEIAVTLDASEWDEWPGGDSGVWDLQLDKAGEITTLVFGDVKITQDVTL